MQYESTIVVVDDSMLMLRILGKQIEKHYHVVQFQDGFQALDYMAIHSVSIALLDVFMPKIDGYDMIKIMKKNKLLKKIPVIFLSGAEDEAVEKEGLALGAVDFLHKPVKEEILFHSIETHIEKKQKKVLYYYQVDINGNFVDCDEHFLQMLGNKSVGDVLMKNIYDFQDIELMQKIERTYRLAKVGEIQEEDMEFQNRSIHRNVVPVYYEGNMIVGVKEIGYAG